MKKQNENGFAKLVANFYALKSFVIGFGVLYTPTKASIMLAQLESLYTMAADALQSVIGAKTVWDNAVNERYSTFSNIRSMSTRMLNYLETTDATPKQIADARGFNRKIQGQRAIKIKDLPDPLNPDPKHISASQQSYEQLRQHFLGFISLLKSVPSYIPNEDILKPNSLLAHAEKMLLDNQNVADSYTVVSNLRIERDQILYFTNTSIVNTAVDVKKYVKAAFGATSQQFKSISGIKFIRKY